VSERPSIWNFESLYEMLCQRIDDNDRRYEQRHDHNVREQESKEAAAREALEAAMRSAKEAVAKAQDDLDQRLQNQNEWRGRMEDQVKRFVTREEYEAKHNALTDRVNIIGDRTGRIEATGLGRGQLWAWIVGGLGTAAVLTDVLLRLRGP
jgi:hypothetical protein